MTFDKTDSIDKIIYSYFSAVTRQDFVYKGEIHNPKDLILDTTLLRSFTCPPNCGACCRKFTMDWLPKENIIHPKCIVRKIIFNGKTYNIISDLQEDNGGYYCRYLDQTTGWCTIHESHALSCDFELTRFLHFEKFNRLRTQLYGRGWNMTTIKGTKGAECQEIEFDLNNLIRKIKRLKDWTDYFELETCIPEILDWLENGNHNKKHILRVMETGLKKHNIF